MRWQGAAFAVVCIGWMLVAPVAAFLAVMSPMLGDSGANLHVWILMANFVTFPLACLLAPIAAWIARRKGRGRLSWALAAAPAVWLIVPAVIWTAMS